MMHLPSRHSHGVIYPLPACDFPVLIDHLMRPRHFPMFLDRPANPKMNQIIADDMLGILMGPHVLPKVLHCFIPFLLSRLPGSRLRHRGGAKKYT